MENKKYKVYIAGPYTKPDPCINTKKAIVIADMLLELGFVPFIPHLSHFWHTISPKEYDKWIEYDLEWLKCCDVMFVIEGDSEGVKIEERECSLRGIPKFNSFSHLLEWRKGKEKKCTEH